MPTKKQIENAALEKALFGGKRPEVRTEEQSKEKEGIER